MIFRLSKLSSMQDARARLTLTLGIAGLVILTPFSINNLIQGCIPLGIGGLIVVLITSCNAWSILRGRYYPLLTSLVMAPLLLVLMIVALRTRQEIGYLWSYPVAIMLYFVLPERQAWVANAALMAIVLPSAWDVFEPKVAVRAAVTFGTVNLFSAVSVRVITEQQTRLEKLVVTDTLTGLLNRSSLQDTLEQAIYQNNRSGVPMTVVAIDLDRFKLINDTLGHSAGDIVLRGVGRLMNNRARKTDRVFRLGGEEFLVFLYGADLAVGRQVAEELRNEIATMALLPNRPVTASVGVAALLPDENWSDWIRRSDENLYQAKLAGRNRVVA